jgi:dimethylhistidine N-methyltransferase
MTAAPEPMDIAAEDPDRFYFYCRRRKAEDSAAEILTGLRQMPKSIPPKYFYDSEGAALFDRITALPEYYLTRTEREIFRKHGEEMAEAAGRGRMLIEPGSGSSEKVELLLDALKPDVYVPLEITESHLLNASRHLVSRYPWLTVHAVCDDYSDGIELPEALPDGQRLLFFPGSTIGNFEPDQAARFLKHLHRACGDDGAVLIGVDLRKDSDILTAAYNDSESITARFNLNVLDHVNRLTRGNFEPRRFRHSAFFNERESRIEMHLESLESQRVTLAGEDFHFARGERIHTENSYKYTVSGFRALAGSVGFRPRHTWCDPNQWFSVHLLEAG